MKFSRKKKMRTKNRNQIKLKKILKKEKIN